MMEIEKENMIKSLKKNMMEIEQENMIKSLKKIYN